MTILVTGAHGFIGKNLCSHLRLLEGTTVLEFTRDNNLNDLSQLIDAADFIFHIAGVNRPKDELEFKEHNTQLTEEIIKLLDEKGKKTPILVTSSVQATMDNPYGLSKRAAENALLAWHEKSGAPVYLYRLPGVFGKWCRPNYNSVVATFCNNIANGLPVKISDPAHTITLTYIDDVIKDFVQHLKPEHVSESGFKEVSRTFDVSLDELNQRIQAIHSIRTSLIIPNLEDLLNKFLYATYISYLPTSAFSYNLTKNSDNRGWLAEFVKSQQFGQVFISKTKSGISRGDHWHHTKIEKFLVVEGEAEISFRKKTDSQEVIRYHVTGDDMEVLDIPVGYVHKIKNVGSTDLITIFWANEMLDKENPDTYYEPVDKEKE